MLAISYMQLHSYLEGLLGSKVAIRVVRALVVNVGKIYTIRKLAEDSSVSVSEAAAVVRQLESHGVLGIQPVGRSYLITLNQESYVLKTILKPIIEAERRTLSILGSLLHSNFDSKTLLSVTIFGSVAAQTEKDDSDIDLLVVSDDFDAATTFVASAQEGLSLILSGKISPLIMSRKEVVRKQNDPLVQSILSNYITVAGKDLKEIISKDV